MNFSRAFILRPIATSLLMLAILLSGAVTYWLLPVSALPEVDYPTIEIVTGYPGASPQVMALLVTTPLETQLGQMSGLKQMYSVNSAGSSVITLQFDLAMGLDVSAQEVQEAINAAADLLPVDLPAPPIYSKVNPADAPIVTIAVTSKTLALPEVKNLVDTLLARKLSQVTGVGLVSVAGGQKPAIRISINPAALAAHNLGLDAVRTTIAAANVDQPKGSFNGPSNASDIDVNDQISEPADYEKIILGYHDGAPVRLSDVGSVTKGTENVDLGAWSGQTPAIIVNVQRQPGANVIGVADEIKKLLPELRGNLPASLDLAILSDRTTTIRASIEDIRYELLVSIVLVILVILFFLRSLPATLIPGVTVPLSLVGTFGVMYLSGFSINNLTLMALTIATGFVVDDAIVMIENISRYIEAGDTPREAAIKGARQISFTIVSLTVSLIAVLIPLLFMGDVIGRLFHEFAITLAVSIVISAFISLTLTPMMCALILRLTPPARQSRIYTDIGLFIDRTIARYGIMLRWVLDRQGATLLVTMLTLILATGLYIEVPKGFFPQQDTGILQGVTEASGNISFSQMAARQNALAGEILKDPDVETLSSFIGIDGVNPTLNTGRMYITLKPFGMRDTAAAVIDRLKRLTSHSADMNLYLQPLQDLTIEDHVGQTQYQFTVQSLDPEELAQWVPKLMDGLKDLPAITDVTTDSRDHGLQVFVDVDRDTAEALGVSMADIDNVLYDAFGQRLISTIFTQTNQYRVVMEAAPGFQKGPDSLGRIYVTSADGKQVPLTTLARIVEREAPLSFSRLAQFPVVTLSFNLASGASLGQAVKAISGMENRLGLPDSLKVTFQGAAKAFSSSRTNMLLLILAAVVTMYIVLGILYESYIHPVTILSTLPSAAIGALLALSLSHTDLDIIAVIGIILLIGIVKKNAIMMIDFALDAERMRGMTPREAIYEACLLRFRPILMTTMAALLGALPLMLGTGAGAEIHRPLGITMVGGLIVSQVLTLFTTPVVYLAFDRIATRMAPGQNDKIGRLQESQT